MTGSETDDDLASRADTEAAVTDETVATDYATPTVAELAATRARGYAEGRKLEGARFAAILTHFRQGEDLRIALDLAMKSPDMSAEAIVEFVSALPKQQKTPSVQERMAGLGAELCMGPPIPHHSANGGWDRVIVDTFHKRNEN